MSNLVSIKMPSSYKAKLVAREQDLAELSALITRSKDDEIKYNQAFEEISTLAELCQSTAESLMQSMDLAGILREAPDDDGTPLARKEVTRFRIYSLLTAAALMQDEYKKIRYGQTVVGDVMKSGRGSMLPEESARHAPRSLVSHTTAISRHILDEDDDLSEAESPAPHYVGSGENLQVAPLERPTRPGLRPAMK